MVCFNVTGQKTRRPVLINVVSQAAAEAIAPSVIPTVARKAVVVFESVFADSHCCGGRKRTVAAQRQVGQHIQTIGLKSGILKVVGCMKFVFVGILVKQFGTEIRIVNRTQSKGAGIVVRVIVVRFDGVIGIIDAEIGFVVVFDGSRISCTEPVPG